jgi:hypothetical protein
LRRFSTFLSSALLGVFLLTSAGCGLLGSLPGVASDQMKDDDPGDGRYFEWPPIPETPNGLAGLSPWERGVFVARRIQTSEAPLPHAGWWLDATPGEVSQTQRLVFVGKCLAEGSRSDEVRQMAVFAYCRADIAALDKTAFAAELTGVDKATAKRARAHFDHVAKSAAASSQAIDAMAAADPGAVELTRSLPERARAEHAAALAPWKEAFEVARTVIDLERTGRKSALDGCDETIWPHVSRWIAEHRDVPASDDVLGLMASDPTGHTLAMAAHLCLETSAGLDYGAAIMGERMVVLRAIWGAKIAFDRTDRKLGDVPELWWRARPVSAPRAFAPASQRGIIASVEPAEGGLRVTFKKTLAKYENCAEWRETDKFDGFNDDGSVRYRSVCVKTKWVTDDTTPKPVIVPERFKDGLEKGRLVWMSAIGDGQRFAPVVVHAGPDAKSKPLARYGVGVPAAGVSTGR